MRWSRAKSHKHRRSRNAISEVPLVGCDERQRRAISIDAACNAISEVPLVGCDERQRRAISIDAACSAISEVPVVDMCDERQQRPISLDAACSAISEVPPDGKSVHQDPIGVGTIRIERVRSCSKERAPLPSEQARLLVDQGGGSRAGEPGRPGRGAAQAGTVGHRRLDDGFACAGWLVENPAISTNPRPGTRQLAPNHCLWDFGYDP